VRVEKKHNGGGTNHHGIGFSLDIANLVKAGQNSLLKLKVDNLNGLHKYRTEISGQDYAPKKLKSSTI